jgi:L-amino acid N-acyltransferase YncA
MKSMKPFVSFPPLVIRPASPDDAALLRLIYAPYIQETAITFEKTVPSLKEFRERIVHTLQQYPYLVCEENQEVVGYAYLSAFNPRSAYRHCAETSIYVKKNMRHHGVGKALYQALEKSAQSMGILNLNACIAYPSNADPFLSLDSPHFHEHLGYTVVGRFHQCGFKFGRYYDMIWMEKMIGRHDKSPHPFTPYPELSAK